jgi:hypothetical protein
VSKSLYRIRRGSAVVRRGSKLPRLRLAVVGAVVACLLVPATSLAGSWTWWGYRTNSWETWALASQTPSFYQSVIPRFGWAVYTMGWSWHWNAQSARRLGQCTGITWSASPIIVGCSSR